MTDSVRGVLQLLQRVDTTDTFTGTDTGTVRGVGGATSRTLTWFSGGHDLITQLTSAEGATIGAPGPWVQAFSGGVHDMQA